MKVYATAKSFLADVLADGEWHPAAEIRRAATVQGFSEASLLKAKNQLGAYTGNSRPLAWRLPPPEPAEPKPELDRRYARPTGSSPRSDGRDVAVATLIQSRSCSNSARRSSANCPMTFRATSWLTFLETGCA